MVAAGSHEFASKTFTPLDCRKLVVLVAVAELKLIGPARQVIWRNSVTRVFTPLGTNSDRIVDLVAENKGASREGEQHRLARILFISRAVEERWSDDYPRSGVQQTKGGGV